MVADKKNMTPQDYIDEIKKELTRLNQPKWLPLYTNIISNYEGYPFREPPHGVPQHEILKSLRECPKFTDHAELESYLIYHFVHMKTFKYHAVRIPPTGPELWNPLEQPYSEFSESHLAQTEFGMEYYPIYELATAWLCYRLSFPIQ